MYCFAKICRLCLSHDSALIHCRARDKNNIPNYHKIKVLFPQLVTKTSQHFPIWICTKCQEQVNQAYEFKQKCYKTYKLLRKYSLQLYEANREKNVPDVPTELFQEVKPIIDSNVISIDEEDHSENYYNADDITIVKNELLPNNLKNEPEYHNMIQAIIDNNIETIRQIDSNPTVALKRELIINSEANSKNNEQSVQEVEEAPPVDVSAVNNETVESNNTTNATNKEIESNTVTNPLVATAFTLDYTNASFETFASHVAPNITVITNNNKENATQNVLNNFTRVLRQRKSICYKTMEKCLDILVEASSGKPRTRSSSPKKVIEKKISVKTATKKQQKPKKSLSFSPSTELNLLTIEKYPKRKNNTSQKTSRATELIGEVLREHKKKHYPYFCEKCSKQYIRYAQFRIHTSKCKGNRHQCTVCDKFFASEGNLRRHSKIHNISKLKLNCSLCSNQYANTTNLKKHMKIQHNLIMNNSNPFFQ